MKNLEGCSTKYSGGWDKKKRLIGRLVRLLYWLSRIFMFEGENVFIEDNMSRDYDLVHLEVKTFASFIIGRIIKKYIRR